MTIQKNVLAVLVILVSVTGFLFASFSAPVFAAYAVSVQTNSATVQTNSATLQGSLLSLGGDLQSSVWFQWGTTTSYGNQTAQQVLTSATSFSQLISGLTSNTTYHFRAVGQNSSGLIVYGSDVTFYDYSSSSYSNSQLPVVNAGPNLYLASGLNTGTFVTLQGSAYDPNGGSLTYSWSCSSGNLSSYTSLQPTFSLAYPTSQATSYTCTLTATDNVGLSNSGSTTIFVNSSQGNNSSAYLTVQTNSATSVINGQALLNGYASSVNGGLNTVWFQWGNTTSYGSQTPHQAITGATSFNQLISGLNNGVTYHFQAVGQDSYGNTVYGQDMVIYANGSGTTGYVGNNGLTVTKTGRDLSSGNLSWATSVNANPSDVLEFEILLQNNTGQNMYNVVVKDTLPSDLIYENQLAVSGANYTGDIISGLTIPMMGVGQTVTLSYQTQVAGASSFSYGSTTLQNNVSLSNSQYISGGTSSVSIIVNRSLLGGATSISTGLTDNFFTDSFFLPLVMLIVGYWLQSSGILAWFVSRVKK